MDTCVKCGGRDGAHFGACFLAQLVERFFGPLPFAMFGATAHADLAAAEADLTAAKIDVLERSVDAMIPGDDDLAAMAEAIARRDGKVVASVFSDAEPEPVGPLTPDEAIAKFLDECTAAAEPNHYTPAAHLLRAYNAWAEKRGAPEASARRLSFYMRELPYETGKPVVKGEGQQMAYYGLKLTVPVPPRPITPEAEVVREFMAACTIKAGPAEYEQGGNLFAAYDLWREQAGKAALNVRLFGGALTALGYTRRQVTQQDGTSPICYFGVKLRPEDEWGQPKSDKEQRREQVAEVRELMQKAREVAPPRVEVVETTPEPGDYDRPDWMKPATGYEQTRKQTKVDSDKPGREIPKEYRELIEPLLALPGWRYQKNNRGGKPRIYNAEGKFYPLPNTPSDHKGMLATKTMLKQVLGAPL